MATPAYVPLDPNKPSGPTQAPDLYSASDLANVRALRDAVVCGMVPGFSYSQAGGGTYNPTARIWANATTGVRLMAQCTYGSPSQLVATIQWFWSNDSGATWAAMGPIINITWAAVTTHYHQITAVSTDAGIWVWALSAMCATISVSDAFGSHTTQVGTAVHGLGTMSTQNANAVNITSGLIGGTEQNSNVYIQMLRVAPLTPQTLANGVAWNWGGNSGVQYNAAPGIAIPYIIGPAAGEVKRIWVTNVGAITIGTGGGVTFTWATGYPVWNAAGGTLVCCVAISGAFVLGTTVP